MEEAADIWYSKNAVFSTIALLVVVTLHVKTLHVKTFNTYFKSEYMICPLTLSKCRLKPSFRGHNIKFYMNHNIIKLSQL